MLRVQEMIKRYHRQIILKNLKVEFRTKCINVIIGPSGCGKTTLFNCISGLEPFEHGTVLLNDNIVVAANGYKTKELKQIGYVLQGFSLFSHLTVINNLILAPRVVHKEPKAKTSGRAHALLKRMHLIEKQSVYPNQLSGGQQQRVAIARAIMMNPEVLLLDEPTNALDPQLIHVLEDTLKHLISDGLTLVVSTHNMDFAKRIADYSYFMYEGEIIESSEKANLLLEPYNPKIRHFIQEEETYGI